MSSGLLPLVTIAAFTGIVHTLLGPDHYLPFIALAKARSWSRTKTTWVTLLCGLGHILGAVAIGYLALGLRISLSSLEVIEATRSDIAAWALIAFGFTYFVWGLKRLSTREQVSQKVSARKLSPAVWAMFIIFVVGPCEPLFILMSYPAVASSPAAVLLLISVFGATTIATMLTAVLAASYGLSFVRGRQAMRFAPVVTGLVVMFCGAGIKFLGL